MAKIIWKAQQKGLRVNQQRVREVAEELRQKTQAASLQAQAVVGWPLNVGSPMQVAHQLYTVEGLREPKKRKR